MCTARFVGWLTQCGTILLWILKLWGLCICPKKDMRRAGVRPKIDLQISLVILFQAGPVGSRKGTIGDRSYWLREQIHFSHRRPAVYCVPWVWRSLQTGFTACFNKFSCTTRVKTCDVRRGISPWKISADFSILSAVTWSKSSSFLLLPAFPHAATKPPYTIFFHCQTARRFVVHTRASLIMSRNPRVKLLLEYNWFCSF